MKSFALDTFKYGIDTRRDVLTSVPGTLVTLENGHVNPGGEIEKRKAFVECYDLTIADNSAIAITNLTSLAGVCTATSASHGLATGEFVKISGASQTEYNGTYPVTVTNANTFTYEVPVFPSVSPATGLPVFAYQARFGLEATADGLVTFGSSLLYGSTPAQSQPLTATLMPSGITYQQLKHPSIANDSTETYDRSRHRLTKIVQSLNFNGKAYAIAEFADGRRFLYYDGELVQASANGLVMTGRTDLADIATDLGRQVEAIGWAADVNVNESAATENGSVLVKSPVSNSFSLIPEDTSSSGSIGIKLIAASGDSTLAGTNPVLASTGFTITTFSGTWDLSIHNDNGTTYPTLIASLLAAPITGATGNPETAAAIAAGVNDLTYVHGYTAIAEAATGNVRIFAPDGGDVSGTPLLLRVTYTTGVAVPYGSTPPTLRAEITFANPLNNISQYGRGSTIPANTLAGEFAALVSGGTVLGGSSAYNYAWSVDVPTAFQIQGTAGTSRVTITYKLPITIPTGPVVGEVSIPVAVRCTVTDGSTPVQSVVATAVGRFVYRIV